MTTPRLDHDIALPHAGLLAYFRGSTLPSQQFDVASLSSIHNTQSSQGTRDPNITPAKDHDEEASFGFWGEYEHDLKEKHSTTHHSLVKRGYYGIYAFCCFWFAVSICILGAFGAFFVLDLVFTQVGMGTGMATRMVHRNVGRGVGSYEVRRVAWP